MQSERKRVLRPVILQSAVVIAWMAAFGWLRTGRGDGSSVGSVYPQRLLVAGLHRHWDPHSSCGLFGRKAAPLAHGRVCLRSLLQIGILFLPLFYLPLAVTSELSTDTAKSDLSTLRTL